MTPLEVLAARLERVRTLPARHGVDALLVTHPPNLRYATDFDGTAGTAIVSSERTTLVVDGRYATAILTHGPVHTGLVTGHVAPASRTTAEVAIELAQTAAVRLGFEADHLTVAALRALDRGAREAGVNLVPIQGAIEGLRVVKDTHEVSLLREAARRLSAVMQGVRADLAPGMREWDVAAAFEAGLRRTGFSRTAFDTIVAAGPNGARPHHRASERRLEPGDLVLLDFGGVYNGYCADLSRTASLGEPSRDAARLHDAVLRAHDAAIAAVRPGAVPEAIDAAARRVLEQAGFGDAFTHATGHGLGLEAHERPRIGPGRTARNEPPADASLAAGMVITIEPGAYLPGFGGVRIEDDVLVTPDGCEVLTTAGRALTLVDG